MRCKMYFSPDTGGGSGPQPQVDPKSRPPAQPTIRPKQIGEDVEEEGDVNVDEQKQTMETWHRAGGDKPGENKPKP